MFLSRRRIDEHIDTLSKQVNIVPAADQASTMNRKVGETFTISLESNPTTGYMWQAGFDSELLKLVDRKFVSDSTIPGSPGVETFEFLALKEGEVKVKMIYKRSWEAQILEEHVTLVSIAP